MLKYFDRDQFARHDAHAKEVARQFWINLGYDCIENRDEYGVDLLVEDKVRKFGSEVEVKTRWHGPEFNFPTLHIPFRKKKFTKQGNPSISAPSYLAGATQPTLSEQATKSGSGKTTPKRKSRTSKRTASQSSSPRKKSKTMISEK